MEVSVLTFDRVTDLGHNYYLPTERMYPLSIRTAVPVNTVRYGTAGTAAETAERKLL